MQSVFYSDDLVRNLRWNVENEPWGQEAGGRIVRAAQPWRECPDRLLWDAMFGPTLKRSWMVRSSGHCPACKADASMYAWVIDPGAHPWKVQCPSCDELFPKNDFRAFYRSGLDAHGVFDADLADRALLVPQPALHDPQRPDGFGIDDGNGYSDGEHTWMFVATYLIYGQWKQFVHAGILRLADAYTVTGDPVYARKAGILLDRVADLYPDFDFAEQGWLYERQPDFGYVSNWHDACKEVRQLANAYDQVRPALLEDDAFVSFVQRQAERYDLSFDKTSAEAIADHVETRIFRDTIANVHKIKSNFPGQEVALITMEAVLERTLGKDSIRGKLDAMIAEAVAVDGVTGEKGLENYSAGVLHYLSEFLASLERMSPGFLAAQIERHPALARTWRFHVDTWCLERFYPSIGDSGTFASEAPDYRGLPFDTDISLLPSAFTFAWALYEATNDPDYVRVLYRANGNNVEGLPYDLGIESPDTFQSKVRDAIDTHGEALDTGSVNFEDWHLGILRSGAGDDARALWMAYDTGRRHGHVNGLTLGLFARGLDLLPDFGYLPVHRGGWSGPHVEWYKGTAAHNTVLVDGRNQELNTEGTTERWQVDDGVQAFTVSAPSFYGIETYRRTCVLVDVDDAHFYVVDWFEVDGGADHAYFLRGPESTLATEGLDLADTDPFGHGTIMQNDRAQPVVPAGWSVTWRHAHAPVHLRYTGLTKGLTVGTAESWVSAGKWSYDDLWIPTLIARNQGDDGLATSFVGVIDVFGETPVVEGAMRGESADGLEVRVELTSGDSHVVQVGDRVVVER